MVFTVEGVNFLVILSSGSTVLNTVMNFMALATIAEFDDFFYKALGEDEIKNLLDT